MDACLLLMTVASHIVYLYIVTCRYFFYRTHVVKINVLKTHSFISGSYNKTK